MSKIRILVSAVKKFHDDHGFFLSSGITFSVLLCLIPFMLLMLSLLGTYLYGSRDVLNYIRRYLENVLPSLDPRITRNMMLIIQSRKIAGVLGVAGLIWASTWVFSSLRTALNIVFQGKKGGSVLRGKGIDLVMIFLTGFFLLMSMTFTSAASYIQGSSLKALWGIKPTVQFILKYLIPFFFSLCLFFLIYKILPNRKVQFKPALQAACFTSLFWEMAKQLFGWYVIHLGRFSIVYGSLSTLAIFFLWVYYSSAILVLGGEVAFLLQTAGSGRRGKE
jgi:membrane protein